MGIPAGSRLGPYEILAPIGAGGMGEVYRAKDPRLGRDVAIKVLPASFSADPDRLRRFEQEARAAGLLNHPNITAVFDIGEDEQSGAPYVVQELLEGETLRTALTGGRLALRRTVDYAVGIARGLAAAHEKGIVHRDLKPENVFVTNDGQIKILDFGLAKLTEMPGGTDQTNQPTATEPGVVLGTLGYMSPEQVRGKPADNRSDIFAFGAILYEMLTGKRAFHGDSAADTMSAILKEDPPELSLTSQSIPPAIDRIVRHCLEKSPERRMHSAHDLAFDLEMLSQVSGGVTPIQGRRRLRLAPIVAAAGVVAAALLGFALGRRGGGAKEAGEPVRSYRRLTQLTGAELSPAISPDGQSLAFVKRTNGKLDVWVQRTGGRNPTNLTAGCDQHSYSPSFSPDGNLIAYGSLCGGGGLFLMGATGENNRRLAEMGSDPAWSPDGRELVFNTESGWQPAGRTTTSELWIADASTGKTRKIFDGDAVQPSVSPHGLRIAYWGLFASGSQRDIWTIPYGGLAKGEKPVPVTRDPALDWNPVWSADGRYLYFLSDRSGSMNLWRVPIEEKTGRTLGPPEPRMLPARWVFGFSMTRDGKRLGYVAEEFAYSVERLSFDGVRGLPSDHPVEIIQSSESIFNPASSPDGARVLFDSSGAPQEDIFVMASDGTGLRKLTDDAPRDRNARFSPDGKRIVFQSDRSGDWEIWTINPDGSGMKQLTNTHQAMYIPLWSPDGHRIAVSDGRGVSFLELNVSGGLAAVNRLPDPPGQKVPTAADWIDPERLLVSLYPRDFDAEGTLGIYSVARHAYEELSLSVTGGLIRPGFLSPHWLTFDSKGKILVTDLAGKSPRVLADSPRGGGYRALSSSRDGKSIFLIHIHENADIWEATAP